MEEEKLEKKQKKENKKVENKNSKMRKPIKQLSETQESSSSNDEKEKQCKANVMSSLESTCEPKIGDYVIVCYDESYFPGQVASVVGGDYLVNAMTPSGKQDGGCLIAKTKFGTTRLMLIQLSTPQELLTQGVLLKK
ncbi:hypothetical protein HHI36_011315 [Cryptolaemus montrouzieri]|uniref:Uncharacterized protein n=1 Tax=Cryptolaemus montrouzieri TaxID=559131 RepID=A0ABD2MLE9_9CUCU